MKYIKIFEDISTDDYIPNKDVIRQDIEYILVDLEDFDINYNFDLFQRSDRFYAVEVSFSKKDTFSLNEIKDRLLMIIDYMELEWFDIKIDYYFNGVENDIFITSLLHSNNLEKISKKIKFYKFAISIEKNKKKNFIHRNIDKFINKIKRAN